MAQHAAYPTFLEASVNLDSLLVGGRAGITGTSVSLLTTRRKGRTLGYQDLHTKRWEMRKRIAAAISGTLLAAMVPMPQAQAYSWWTHRAVFGVGDWGRSPQHYWIDGSASAQAGRIDTAMSQWVNTSSYVGQGNPVDYRKTTTKSSSRMDLYQEGAVQSSYCAVTEFYVDSTRIGARGSAPTKDWVWSKIIVAYPTLFNSSSCTNRQGIIAHEMGHGFGLAHNTYPSTLMYSGIASTGITRAQLDDVKGVTFIYG